MKRIKIKVKRNENFNVENAKAYNELFKGDASDIDEDDQEFQDKLAKDFEYEEGV